MAATGGDAARRKRLLQARMEIERAELAIELTELRHAAAPPQLAKGLWSTVFGGRKPGPRAGGIVEALVGSVGAEGLLRAVLGSGLLSGLFSGRAQKVASGGAHASGTRPGSWAPLFQATLSRYPMLMSLASLAWPLRPRGRTLRRLATVATIGAVAWQLWKVWQTSNEASSVDDSARV